MCLNVVGISYNMIGCTTAWISYCISNECVFLPSVSLITFVPIVTIFGMLSGKPGPIMPIETLDRRMLLFGADLTLHDIRCPLRDVGHSDFGLT